MLIDSKARLNTSSCRDDCREVCKGCCWYKATPLCREFADCPDCTKIKPHPCVYIYHDLQAESGQGSNCAACCDCTDDEGCESCGCGCWYSYAGELRCSARAGGESVPGGIVPCCTESCGTGKPCTPIAGSACNSCQWSGFPDTHCWDPDCLPDFPGGPSLCRNIRPVYKWRGECWTLMAGLFGGEAGDPPTPDDTGLPCGTVSSATLCGYGWGDPDYYLECEKPQECDGQFCECCDTCEPEIISWCEWGGVLVTPDYHCPDGFGGGFPYCQNDDVDFQCGDCDYCCSGPPDPPNCVDNCVNDCPPGERCCAPIGPMTDCFCKDEDKDCEPEGLCNIAHPCCDAFSTQAHSLSVQILVNAKFELGGEAGWCSGGCEGLVGEAFGNQSLNVVVGANNGNQDDLDQYDLVCGRNPAGASQNDRIICASSDSCGLMPGSPSTSPKFGPDVDIIPNCDVIDRSCCPQQYPAYITDYNVCGAIPGNIPHAAHQADCQGPYYCPKGVSRFGNKHLGMAMAVGFSVRCDGLYGGGFSVGEVGQFNCPRLALGHWCGGLFNYGCPEPGGTQCGHSGTPGNFLPDSWSVGSVGSINIPGYYSGRVEYSGAYGCTGNVRMSVTFTPNDTITYNPISFSSLASHSDHPCAGSGNAYQWFDWDYQGSGLGNMTEALHARVRENCGIRAPSYFHPTQSPLITEIKNRHTATGQTIFAALELPSAIDILQLSFANKGGSGGSSPPGYGDVFRTQGFGGCDLRYATHDCNNCPGTVVDLGKASWSRGSVQAYGRMGYN